MADDQYDWQLLLDIFYKFGRLDHPLYEPLAHDSYPREYRLLALESALRSGEIPMHGCRVTALGLASSERIETKIDVETAIDIPINEITLCKSGRIEFAVFKRVRADLASVERWLRENVADEPRAAGEEAQDHVEAPSFAKAPEDRAERPCLTKRRRPIRGSAQRTLEELYPGDIPDQATLPNALLFRKVHAKIKEAGRPAVSDDTILRAAGRRK